MTTNQNAAANNANLQDESGKALLASCLRGDRNAWELFVNKYGPIIHRTVRLVVRARIRGNFSFDIDDITQEVCLRLVKDDFRQLRSYNPAKASLATWLSIVTHSTTIDFLRKKQLPTVPLNPDYHSQHANNKEVMEAGEIKIPPGLLSPRQKLVLQMIFDKNFAVAEISRILGIEEQTVRSTKHKALNKLRNHFKA